MKCKTNKVVVSYIVVNLPCVRVLFCERSFPGSIHRQAALYVCTGLGMSTTVGNNPNDSESIPLSLIRTGSERDKEREQGAQATICYSLLWLDVHPLEKPQATSCRGERKHMVSYPDPWKQDRVACRSVEEKKSSRTARYICTHRRDIEAFVIMYRSL